MDPTPPPPALGRNQSILKASVIQVDNDDTIEINLGSTSRTKANIKYRTGKYANLELVPQPSDKPLDPLNWPSWKRELVFLTICFTAATASVLKLILSSVNSVIATEFNTTYTSAVALTAAPFLISSFSGIFAVSISQAWGKRCIYLVSILFMFAGSMWNMHIHNSYAQFMTARIFQGIGWGAFDALALSSIQDLYFAHQKGLRYAIYNLITLTTTFGSPVLGGFISQSRAGWRNQFMYLTIFQGVAILLLIFCPETSFLRPRSQSQSRIPFQSNENFGFASHGTSTTISSPSSQKSKVPSYLQSLHPMPFRTKATKGLLMEPVTMLVTPTTVLAVMLPGFFSAVAIALASSVSLLFAPMPNLIFPTRIGLLFTLPLVISLLTLIVFNLILFSLGKSVFNAGGMSPSRTPILFFSAPGLIIAASGSILFGFYLYFNLNPWSAELNNANQLSSQGGPAMISLKMVSGLFSLIVTGAAMLENASSAWLISESSLTAGSSPSETKERHLPSIDTHKNFLAGILILLFPVFLSSLRSIRITFITLPTLQLALSLLVLIAILRFSSRIEAIDARFLGKKKTTATSKGGRAREEDELPVLEKWRTGKSFVEV